MATVALNGNSATGESGATRAAPQIPLIGLAAGGQIGTIRVVEPEDLTLRMTGVAAVASLGILGESIYASPQRIAPAFRPYPYEGAWIAQRDNTHTPETVPAGPGAFVAGPNGLIVGRFGYGDTVTGMTMNMRTDAGQLRGLVVPIPPGVMANWSRMYQIGQDIYIRAGLPITMVRNGNFWVRFAAGAYAGQPVYAHLLDGSALAGETTAGELTPWFVASDTPPGGLGKISTTNFYGA